MKKKKGVGKMQRTREVRKGRIGSAMEENKRK